MSTTFDPANKRPLDLSRLVLGHGKHSPGNLDNGVVDQGAACVNEAWAWRAGLDWTDAPPCVSPVLRTYGMALNDRPDPAGAWYRKQFVTEARIDGPLGTAGDGLDGRRSYLALDWLVRVYTPAWLRLVPALVADADALAGFRPITDLETAGEIGAVVREAAGRARTVGAALGAALGAAAWAAAWAAARDAAGAAAWDAARDAARDAAGAAAWDAARAGAAARAAARAGAAAWAAWAALNPTVTALQISAMDLFDRMVRPSADPS